MKGADKRRLLVGALDSGRFHWTPETSWIVIILGIAFNFMGLSFFEIAKRQNKIFSSVVRIQNERGHHGPPRDLLFNLCSHSSLVYIFLFLLRTAVEDDLLTEYKTRVKFRVIPFIC